MKEKERKKISPQNRAVSQKLEKKINANQNERHLYFPWPGRKAPLQKSVNLSPSLPSLVDNDKSVLKNAKSKS